MKLTEFENLVVEYCKELRPLAVSLTRDRDAANDLCQETICKALRYRDKYIQGTNLKAWLHTIMRNIFVNEYRRNSKKKKVLDSLKHWYRQDTGFAESNVRMKEIQKAVHQLPSVSRTACLLYLDGYKYQEIAFSLNQSLGTIKSRIHFAKKLLEKQLDR